MEKLRIDNVTLMYTLLLIVYPSSVLAADSIFQNTTGFSFYQALYAVFMGFWGALAYLTERYSKDTKRRNWIPVIFSSMSNSTLAAAIGFMVCVHLKVSPALTGAVCALSGFGGARFMSWAYKKFIAKADVTIEGL